VAEFGWCIAQDVLIVNKDLFELPGKSACG
jgi:hypothetical protein